MVDFAQAEIIQIYRKRIGINQGEFGSKAFNTSYASGRTKMKNIELGRQVPTPGDLMKIAALLGVPVTDLMPPQNAAGRLHEKIAPRIFLSTEIINRFPGLDAYVDMLNKAARVNDSELLVYIGAKIANLLRTRHRASRQATR